MTAPLRFGFVGSGFIAGVIASAIQQVAGVVVTAVASRNPANATALAARFGIPHVFDHWQALVASAAVDAVYVATPTSVREEICIAAAQQGKHVLGDKPFLSHESIQRITAACRANRVAFMDATHFVHHPRTQQIKRELSGRIGRVLALNTAFFFPVDRSQPNIRLDPQQEPMGAIGDMAWYNMRAVVEYLQPAGAPVQVQSALHREAASGAVIRGAGMLAFADGRTATWNAGYDVGNLIMTAELMGERGLISLDDFVLDWESSLSTTQPPYTDRFIQRSGPIRPDAFETVLSPVGVPQSQHMIAHFLTLAHDPTGPAVAASIQASEQTQHLVDRIWHSAKEY
jgi:predicted dehydrogenase